MNERRWTKSSMLGWAGAALFLLLFSLPMLEILRPGLIACPLRRLLEKHDLDGKVDLDDLWQVSANDWTPAQRQQIDAKAAEWRAEALRRHPILHLEVRPLSDEENAYWQLCLLQKSATPLSDELTACFALKGEVPAEQAAQALSQNAAWVDEIERIAALPHACLPDESTELEIMNAGEFAVFNGSRILLLKARLAAQAGDETEALRCISAALDLNGHLQHPDTAHALSVIVTTAVHDEIKRAVFRHILPRLGPTADLEAWQGQLERMRIQPEELTEAIRASWQMDSRLISQELILQQQRHRLIDPEATALAWAQSHATMLERLQNANFEQQVAADLSPSTPARLSPEGQECIENMTGFASLRQRILTSARRQACAQAALELTMLEPGLGHLDAEDSRQVTHDPLTNKPFVYDPVTRSLDAPADLPDYRLEEPIKLPW